MKNLQYIFILALCLLSIPALRAKEGADQYPFGAENWFAGALPGPGFYFINYAGYYGGQLKDGSGQNANLGGTTPTVAATFDAFRFLQITPYKFLGADWGVHVIVPVVNQRLDMGGFNRFEASATSTSTLSFWAGIGRNGMRQRLVILSFPPVTTTRMTRA